MCMYVCNSMCVYLCVVTGVKRRQQTAWPRFKQREKEKDDMRERRRALEGKEKKEEKEQSNPLEPDSFSRESSRLRRYIPSCHSSGFRQPE